MAAEPQRSLHDWRPDEPPPPGQRHALLRLTAAIRQTIDLVMDTDAPEDEIDAAAAALEAWNERLAAQPRGRPLRGYAEASTAGNVRSVRDNSAVTGALNPIAPPMTFRVFDDYVTGEGVIGIPYEGPPGHVHGGVTAMIFDELLGLAQSLTAQSGMTGTLTVRYRRPTPLGQPLAFRGIVDRVEGRKIFTSATLHANGVLCAESEAVFISVAKDTFSRLAEQTGRPPLPDR
ncbi:MAG: PaaI family thioesterase [Dehalococcoidia bacterium]